MADYTQPRVTHSLGAANDALVFTAEGRDGNELSNFLVLQLDDIGTLTISFEARVPGESAWEAIAGTDVTDSTATNVTSTTADGLWRFDVAGLDFRARVSAYTSGTVNATGNFVKG